MLELNWRNRPLSFNANEKRPRSAYEKRPPSVVAA